MLKTKYIVVSVIMLTMLSLIISGCGVITDNSKNGTADVNQLSNQTDITLKPGTVLSVSELLYLSGDDLTAIDPDRCYKVAENGGINVISATSGDVLESHVGNSEYSKLDEGKWDELFSGGLTVDISSYTNKHQYKISDSYLLYFMDKEVWLGTFNDSSLTSLSKMEIRSE